MGSGRLPAGDVHRAALRKRRLRRRGAAEEDWELLDDGSDLPQLDAESRFFPASESGDGVHPLLSELAASDPDALRSVWTRLYSSGGGDGLSLATLREKVRGYGRPDGAAGRGPPAGVRRSVGSDGGEAAKHFPAGVLHHDDLDRVRRDVRDGRRLLPLLAGRRGGRHDRPSQDEAERPWIRGRACTAAPPSSRSGAVGSAVVGLGVGGSPVVPPTARPRRPMEGCRCLPHDPAFGDGDLMSGLGEGSLYRFDAEGRRGVGCGGGGSGSSTRWDEREKARVARAAGLERARAVDKRGVPRRPEGRRGGGAVRSRRSRGGARRLPRVDGISFGKQPPQTRDGIPNRRWPGRLFRNNRAGSFSFRTQQADRTVEPRAADASGDKQT